MMIRRICCRYSLSKNYSQCLVFYLGIVMGVTLGCMLTLALTNTNSNSQPQTIYYYFNSENGATVELMRPGERADTDEAAFEIIKPTEPSPNAKHISKRDAMVNNNYESDNNLHNVLTELEERSHADIQKWYNSDLISRYNTQASFRYTENDWPHQRDVLVLLLMRTCEKLSKLPTLLDTWTGKIDTLIFIGSSCVIPDNLKRSFVIQLPELNSRISSAHKRTHSSILKYAFDKYGHDYDWFLYITDENTYVNVKYLRKYIHQLNNDEMYYIGSPNRLAIEEMQKYELYQHEQYCQSKQGILLSSKLVSSVVSLLNGCHNQYRHVRTVTISDEDRELGRCIGRKLKTQCWAGAKEQNKLFYLDSEEELSSNPGAIFNTQQFSNVITIYPVQTDIQMHIIHFYYEKMEYNSTKKQLLSLSKAVNHICQSLSSKLTDRSMHKLFKHCSVNFKEDLAEIKAEETTFNFTPRAREEVQSWDYFDAKTLYQDESINPRKIISKLKYLKRELEDVLLEMVRLANLEYPSPLEFHGLVNGYVRHNGLKGNEYIINAEFTEVSNPYVIVHRRFSLLKPLSTKFIVQSLKNTVDELVSFLVPISGVARRFDKFLEMYERLALMGGGIQNTRLVLVVFGEEDIAYSKSKLDDLSSRYPHSKFMMVQGIGDFARAKALDMGMNALEDDDLVFICDVDMDVDLGFLNRCRQNTIKGTQVFYPVMFKWYNADYVYKFKHKPDISERYISRATGHWGQYSYGMACIYKSDYTATGGFDTTIMGWGEEDVRFFETVLKSKLRVLRAPDPGLTHRWHEKKCYDNYDKERYKRCLTAKADVLADKRELAQHLFALEEKKTTQKFFCF